MSLKVDKSQSTSSTLLLPVKTTARANNSASPPPSADYLGTPNCPNTGKASSSKSFSEMETCVRNGSSKSTGNIGDTTTAVALLTKHSEGKGLCASIESIAQLFTLSWDMNQKEYITENNIKFSIQFGLIPKEMNNNISINAYSLYISSPSGLRYPYEAKLVRESDNVVSKVNCCFRAVECGDYTIDVKFCGISIRGCPFNIYISRDYQTVRDRQPIVSWTLQSTEKIKTIKPWGICSNTKTEQIYIVDRENHEVLVYGPDGEFHFSFGKLGTQIGKFHQPVAIAYDNSQDRILISDRGNDRIQIFSAAGEYMSFFGCTGSANGEFLSPWGIAVSNDGNFIAVADTKNRRVQLFDSGGKFLRLFRGSFGYLKGITFDCEGRNIIVSDWMNSSVFKINLEMTECSTVMNKSIIGRPAGVIVDVAGNLLVCDTIHNCIVILDWKYEFTGELIQNTGDSEIFRPKDITYMRGGFFALLDSCSEGQVRIC